MELPGGSSWTWDAKVDGCVVTSGIATTKTSARVRLVNFVKFDILEPLWPADPSQPQLAQYSETANKLQD
jgi:hypothetical protein